jgi:hypothetical protein
MHQFKQFGLRVAQATVTAIRWGLMGLGLLFLIIILAAATGRLDPGSGTVGPVEDEAVLIDPPAGVPAKKIDRDRAFFRKAYEQSQAIE